LPLLYKKQQKIILTATFFMNSTGNLDYSRVEVAADARRRGWSCGISLRIRCNKADAGRSARSESKKCRYLIEITLWMKWSIDMPYESF